MKRFENFFGIVKVLFYISAFGLFVSKGNIKDIFSIALVVSTVLCLAGFVIYEVMLKKEEKEQSRKKSKIEVTTLR